jgi:hypothetical protein
VNPEAARLAVVEYLLTSVDGPGAGLRTPSPLCGWHPRRLLSSVDETSAGRMTDQFVDYADAQ